MGKREPLMASYMNLSFYSLLDEVCLGLANSGNEKQSALIEEGLRLSSLAESKMKDKEGNVTNPIAYKSHDRTYSKLRGFNESNV